MSKEASIGLMLGDASLQTKIKVKNIEWDLMCCASPINRGEAEAGVIKIKLT
jgi:hypothetical protein